MNIPTLLYPKDILLSDGRPDKQIDSNPITKLIQSDIRWAASVIIARLPAIQPPTNWVIWKRKNHHHHTKNIHYFIVLLPCLVGLFIRIKLLFLMEWSYDEVGMFIL